MSKLLSPAYRATEELDRLIPVINRSFNLMLLQAAQGKPLESRTAGAAAAEALKKASFEAFKVRSAMELLTSRLKDVPNGRSPE